MELKGYKYKTYKNRRTLHICQIKRPDTRSFFSGTIMFKYNKTCMHDKDKFHTSWKLYVQKLQELTGTK